jgi:NADPH2:quinone reductase
MDTARRMQAIQIDRYGGPEVIVRRQIPVPEPGPGQLLVRIAQAGINFMDIHTRIGKYEGSRTYPLTLPITLGMEGAGTVAARGPDVTDFAVGDRAAFCLAWGSYAEYALVPAARTAHVPDGLSLALAAATLFHGLTAHYLVHTVGRLGPGSTCLVHAASGGIGRMLVQMAATLGVTVYATASTEGKRAVARARGASVVVPYGEGAFADDIRKATGGKGVDVVFDPLGRSTLRDSFRATRRQGLVVNYGSVAGSVKDLDPIELGEAGSLFLTRPRLADHVATAKEFRERADAVFSALLNGTLTVDIADRYTLANVEEAHEALEQRRMLGKPIMDISVDEKGDAGET